MPTARMPRQGRLRLRVWCHTAGELYEEKLEGRPPAPVPGRQVDDSERAGSGFRICPISTQTRNDSRERNPTQGLPVLSGLL